MIKNILLGSAVAFGGVFAWNNRYKIANTLKLGNFVSPYGFNSSTIKTNIPEIDDILKISFKLTPYQSCVKSKVIKAYEDKTVADYNKIITFCKTFYP